MNWKSLGWGMVMGLLSVHANAAEPWAPTDTEMTSLPPYCKVRFKSGATSPEYQMWEKTLGKDFLHTHHYCAGVNFINRYYRARSQQDKLFNLRSAQGTLNYMVEKASPSYSLMPDVYLNLGVVYSLMNQPAQAITHFNKAIELNPRLPKAYSALSGYYAKTKQSAKALEIVTAGLRHNPDTKSLQRRYRELGGKLPYPEPVEPTPAVEVEITKSEEPATPTPISSSVEPAASPTSTTPATAEPVAEPEIGSPTNPYCRFCPD